MAAATFEMENRTSTTSDYLLNLKWSEYNTLTLSNKGWDYTTSALDLCLPYRDISSAATSEYKTIKYTGIDTGYNYIYKKEIYNTNNKIYDYNNNIYTGTITTNTDYQWDWKTVVQTVDPTSLMRGIIQSRMAPRIITSRTPMRRPDAREIRARETLKLILTDEEYRGFLKNGFVSIVAKSGLIYQVFPGHGITCVYDRGKMIERLCVVLRGDYTETDSVIMRCLLILNDEAEFKKHAIKHGSISRQPMEVAAVDDRPLTELFQGLRAA